MSAGDRFEIVSLNVSDRKGIAKSPVPSIRLAIGVGVEGDAHSGPWHRQVSLLAMEDIELSRSRGIDVNPGDFAENVTTRGIDLASLPVSSVLEIGDAALEITQIGKECHSGCAVFKAVGDCVMPKRGVFARVLKGGTISRESACRHRI